MKLSELDLEVIKQYLRIDFEEDDIELTLYLAAAKSYVKGYTGLSEEEMDEEPMLIIIVLQLIAKFYEIKTIHDLGVVDSIFSDMMRLNKGSWL